MKNLTPITLCKYLCLVRKKINQVGLIESRVESKMSKGLSNCEDLFYLYAKQLNADVK